MEINKTRKIIGWVLSIVPIVAVAGSSLAKLTGRSEVVDGLAQVNITNPALLGGIQIICLALYLIPKTSNIGFFLLCSFFGGVIVGSLAQGDSPMVGIGLSVSLYVGTMLRKPELSGLNI